MFQDILTRMAEYYLYRRSCFHYPVTYTWSSLSTSMAGRRNCRTVIVGVILLSFIRKFSQVHSGTTDYNKYYNWDSGSVSACKRASVSEPLYLTDFWLLLDPASFRDWFRVPVAGPRIKVTLQVTMITYGFHGENEDPRKDMIIGPVTIRPTNRLTSLDFQHRKGR